MQEPRPLALLALGFLVASVPLRGELCFLVASCLQWRTGRGRGCLGASTWLKGPLPGLHNLTLCQASALPSCTSGAAGRTCRSQEGVGAQTLASPGPGLRVPGGRGPTNLLGTCCPTSPGWRLMPPLALHGQVLPVNPAAHRHYSGVRCQGLGLAGGPGAGSRRCRNTLPQAALPGPAIPFLNQPPYLGTGRQGAAGTPSLLIDPPPTQGAAPSEIST